MMHRPLTRLPLLALAVGIAAPVYAQSASGGDAAGAPYSVPSDTGTPSATGSSSGGGARPSNRIEIHPYLEVDQVLDAPIKGGGDVLTFTDLSAGIDVSVSTRTVQAQLDYRYDRQIAESGGYGDADVHNGLARVAWQALPGLLTIDGAGLATRTRDSFGDASPDFLTRDRSNTRQVYAAFVGPTIAHRVGDFDVMAAYHFGYVHADNGNGELILGPGQPRFDDFTDSYSHTVNASIGQRPGALPFGWTLSGYWERDQQHFLHARFDDKWVRADVTVPVSFTVAVVGGVGYEKLEQSQRQLLVDANGSAVLDSHDRLQGDSNLPRLLSYEQDGLIWDVGLSWRPNQRARFEIRGGRRYGEWVVYGSADYQLSATSHFQAGIFDDVETFGHGVTGAIGGLPTSFNAVYNPLVGTNAGCVTGTNGGQGGCLDSALASVNGNLFRVTGAYALLSAGNGPWGYSLDANYTRRHYLTPTDAIGSTFLFSGVTEKEATVQANVSRALSPISGVDASLYGTWYDSDFQAFNTGSTYGAGATASYHRYLMPRLLGQISAGVYGYDASQIETNISASALVGMRYTF